MACVLSKSNADLGAATTGGSGTIFVGGSLNSAKGCRLVSVRRPQELPLHLAGITCHANVTCHHLWREVSLSAFK
jgi:hypothetical protein